MRVSDLNGWLRRGWAAWTARSRTVRALIALALLAPLIAAISFWPEQSSRPHADSGQASHGVHTIRPAKPRIPTHTVAGRTYKPGPAHFPSAGSGTATLGDKQVAASRQGGAGGRVRADGTPVWVQPVTDTKGDYHGPSRIKVTVASQQTALKAGVRGLLFTTTPQSSGTGPFQLGVDYRSFANAYGGNYGTRLHLAQLPACALTTPQLPACRTQTPLKGAGNYLKTHNVYGQTSFAESAAPMVMAVTSSPVPDGGPDGTFAATSLKPSGTWSAGGSSGSFTYSYPLTLPPAVSSLIPKVGLSYDSGSVDGETATTQSQASWAGDGWSVSQSYIEQSFATCSDSPEGSAPEQSDAPKTESDMCYAGPVLTMSLDGESTQLVWDSANKTFHTANDNGDVVTHITNSGNQSGTYNNDYWQVVDRAGNVYDFGMNALPTDNGASPTSFTHSVDSEPVFSAHSGDPCYKSTWADSVCTMAYRWNLDYVKDVHANAMAYYYAQDTNSYLENAAPSYTSKPNANATYIRDSHLVRIDYGFKDGQAYTVNGGHAPDQVVFNTDGRCSQGGSCPTISSSNASSFPDVPYDLHCDNGSSCLNASPSFWSTTRLTGITTQQWNGTAYTPVDSWTLNETMPATADGTNPTLWLSSITHTGEDTSAGQGASEANVALPAVTFSPQALDNRVDHSNYPGLSRMRIGAITTETGSTISVTYGLVNPCTPGHYPTPATNTSSCYPVYWTPDNSTQFMDWFNKYQVVQVLQTDPFGGAPTMATSYRYVGGGAWHYDDNEVVKAKYRTYGQWRGFGDVQTFVGQGSDAPTESETTYYRGMSFNGPGSTGNTGEVDLKDSQNQTHQDVNELAGQALEKTSYNYAAAAASGPIQAGVTDGGLYLCLDDSGSTSNGSAITAQHCTSGASQNWVLQPSGTITLAGTGSGIAKSGKCLDVTGSGTANGTLIQLDDCDGTAAQQWQARGDGSLFNPNSGKCITLPTTTPGTKAEIDDCDGVPAQQWSTPAPGTGKVTGSTITSYWVSPATADRTRTGLPDLTANAVKPVETWTRQATTAADGTVTWHKTETDTTYDTNASSPTFADALWVYAHGDLATTNQQTCTHTTYAPPNTSVNLVDLPAEVEVDSVACGGTNPNGSSAPTAAQTNALSAPASVSRPSQVVSDTRTIYDNPTLARTWPQPASATGPLSAIQPTITRGEVSEIQVANDPDGSTMTYQVKSATVYDDETTASDKPAGLPVVTSSGQALYSYDGLGHLTQTNYTLNNAGVVNGAQTINPAGQPSSTTTDTFRGLPLTTTDINTYANNQARGTHNVTATMQYDALGRLTAAWKYEHPTTQAADITYTYQVSNTGISSITTNKLNSGGGYITSTTLYDALLRPRQTQTPTPKSGRLVTDTFYDSRGWTWKTNTNWWDSATTPNTSLVGVNDNQVPNQTVTAFDGQGRPVLATSYWDSQIKSQTATAYDITGPAGGNETITAPLNASGQPYAGGKVTGTIKDALGRTIEQDNYTALPTVSATTSTGTTPITTVSITGGTTQTTTYGYNLAGLQTSITDTATGDVWTSSYDLLGHPLSKTDPDAGTSTMAYDAGGNLIQTTDANGKTLSYTYDALNRKTGQYDAAANAQAPSNQLASWVYDNINNVSGVSYPLGQVTTSTSYIGGSGTGGSAYTRQVNGFNVFGEPTSTTTTIPASAGKLAGSYTFKYGYGIRTGLPMGVTDPATPGNILPAETVTIGHSTALDVPVATGGTVAYQLNATVSAWGQITQQQLGAQAQSAAYVTNTYDPHTGALTDSQISHPLSTLIDDTSYTYDPSGNPTQQTETQQGAATETQCYTYDTLDRLTQAWTENATTNTCHTDTSGNPTATIASGTGAAYWTSWTFNPLGQRLTETDHATPTGPTSNTTTTYNYGTTTPAGAKQAHTLAFTNTSTNGPTTSASASYRYDADGNTTQRNITNAGTTSQQSLTWTDTGQLSAVTTANGGTSYVYDASGNLLIQNDTTTNTSTLYLPGEQIGVNTTTGAYTATRFYPLPGGGQAVRTGTGSNYSFEFTDQHGTSNLVLDPTFTKPTWRQQTPYGAPRGNQPTTWPDNHGFLNKVNDTTTGLTLLGARWYDPTSGTFQSLDPLFEATDPQQQNGYSYSADNPITGSDPDGLYSDPGNDPNNPNLQGCAYWSVADGCPGSDTPTRYGHGGDQPPPDAPGWAPPGDPLPPSYPSWVPQKILNLPVIVYKPSIRQTWLQQHLEMLQTGPSAAYNQFKSAYCAQYVLIDPICGGAVDPQQGLALAGFIPGIGTYADGVNSLWYLKDGRFGDAGLSALAVFFSLADGGGNEDDPFLPGAARVCVRNSFPGTTRVLMADGTSKPISQIRVGDKIANALPGVIPGTSNQEHTVTAIHITHTDRAYTDVTIETHGRQASITSTNHHLYWDATTHAWTTADHLNIGDQLQAANGRMVPVVEIRSYAAAVVTYNLTVDGVHTFYVEAAQTPVLVHNSGLCDIPWSSGQVSAAARAIEGGATSIEVSSRADAEELFLRMFQGQGYRNATGFDGVGTKQYFGSKMGTYHWDDQLGPDGRVLGHGAGNADGDLPHLQIHTLDDSPWGGAIIRIFWGG